MCYNTMPFFYALLTKFDITKNFARQESVDLKNFPEKNPEHEIFYQISFKNSGFCQNLQYNFSP